jgi:hypothetical protein
MYLISQLGVRTLSCSRLSRALSLSLLATVSLGLSLSSSPTSVGRPAQVRRCSCQGPTCDGTQGERPSRRPCIGQVPHSDLGARSERPTPSDDMFLNFFYLIFTDVSLADNNENPRHCQLSPPLSKTSGDRVL